MSTVGRCLRWLSSRRAILVLVWAVSLLIAATAVNVVGIRIAGGIEGSTPPPPGVGSGCDVACARGNRSALPGSGCCARRLRPSSP